MRYAGQAFEVDVPISVDRRGQVAGAAALFHDRYRGIFGVNDPQAPVTFVNLRATVVGVTPKATQPPPPAVVPGRLREVRRIFSDGRAQDAQVIYRAALRAGERIPGPAVIEQYDTTTFVPTGFSIASDAAGNLIGEAD
jgi:N-methylhydantoinase A